MQKRKGRLEGASGPASRAGLETQACGSTQGLCIEASACANSIILNSLKQECPSVCGCVRGHGHTNDFSTPLNPASVAPGLLCLSDISAISQGARRLLAPPWAPLLHTWMLSPCGPATAPRAICKIKGHVRPPCHVLL